MVDARLIASGMVEHAWLHATNDDNRENVVCLAKYVTHGCRQVDGVISGILHSLARNADPYRKKCDPAARSPTPYPTLTINYLVPARGTM